jgi:septum formation inhibitor MinC
VVDVILTLISNIRQITFIMQQLEKESEQTAALKLLLTDKEEELLLVQRRSAQSIKELSRQLNLAQKRHSGEDDSSKVRILSSRLYMRPGSPPVQRHLFPSPHILLFGIDLGYFCVITH